MKNWFICPQREKMGGERTFQTRELPKWTTPVSPFDLRMNQLLSLWRHLHSAGFPPSHLGYCGSASTCLKPVLLSLLVIGNNFLNSTEKDVRQNFLLYCVWLCSLLFVFKFSITYMLTFFKGYFLKNWKREKGAISQATNLQTIIFFSNEIIYKLFKGQVVMLIWVLIKL